MIGVHIRPVWRFTVDGQERDFDFQLIRLLEALHEEPKLTRAAAHAGISYRHAWNLIERWQTYLGAPLVEMERGKGSRLTTLGWNLLWAGQRARARVAPELDSLASEFAAALNAVHGSAGVLLVMHASHDFAVAALRELGARFGLILDVQFRGSFDALAALRRGDCAVAGFHLPLGPVGAALARQYVDLLPADTCRLISFATRTQGVIVAAGNPKRILAVSDLARAGVRMANRQRGSGTRALLDLLFAAEHIDAAGIAGYDTEETTHAAVAALVAAGQADAAFGVQSAAAQYRLDFIPVCRERYLLACDAKATADVAIPALCEMLRSPEFAQAVAALPGYDATGAGEIMDPAALSAG